MITIIGDTELVRLFCKYWEDDEVLCHFMSFNVRNAVRSLKNSAAIAKLIKCVALHAIAIMFKDRCQLLGFLVQATQCPQVVRVLPVAEAIVLHATRVPI